MPEGEVFQVPCEGFRSFIDIFDVFCVSPSLSSLSCFLLSGYSLSCVSTSLMRQRFLFYKALFFQSDFLFHTGFNGADVSTIESTQSSGQF